MSDDDPFYALVNENGTSLGQAYSDTFAGRPTTTDKNRTQLLDHVYTLISIIWSTLATTFDSLSNRILALEKQSPHVNEPISHQKRKTGSAPVSGPRTRCNRCHARGHATSECKTENPAAVRRRVANNTKAREARNLYPPPHPFNSPLPHYHYAHAPHYDFVANPYDPGHRALLVDATELRRRRTQSIRDKKKKKPRT
jgi:hypothetical protein